MEKNWIKLAFSNQKNNVELSGISPIVFHATNLLQAINIVRTNQFYLTFMRDGSNDDMPDEFNKYYFFLSTARTRNNRFFTVEFDVVFELDGRKLGANYKAVPYDFWDEQDRKNRGGEYEQEDRILSKKSTIDNALKYIKSVSMFIPKKMKVSPDTLEMLKILNKKNIPTIIYRNWRDLKIGNKAKQVPISDLSEQVDYTMLTDDDEIDKALLAERTFFANKIYALMYIYEAYKKIAENPELKLNQIKPDIVLGDKIKVGQEYKRYIGKPFHEVESVFSNVLKQRMNTPKDKKAQTEFVKFLRKNKLKDMNEMFSDIGYYSVMYVKKGGST